MTSVIADASFRALANEIPSLVFCADADGEAIHCNGRFQDFTGLADSAFIGGAWFLAVHEEDRAAATAAWKQAIAAQEPYEVEVRLRAADGQYHWFLIRCVPAGANQRVDHWIGVGRDIHDRKMSEASEQADPGGRLAQIDFSLKRVVDARGAAGQIHPEGRDLTRVKTVENQLLESQARVRRIVESGIIAVGYGNVEGVISDVNDAFLKMIGRTREEFAAGRISWRELTAPEYAERDERAIAQLRRDGVCEPYEKEYVLPGRRLPVQIAMAKVESQSSDVDHVALIIDLTTQKAAQAALAASHAQLEQRVADRTAELRRVNERLVHEMKRREALQGALLQSQKLEALGQLTSSVAHDFNNVLAAIIGGFALIEKRTDDPQLLKLAKEGTTAAGRGADLIRKLLAFARQQNIVSQRVDLQPLFDELAPQLRHIAGSDVEVVIADARRLPAVEIDPSQLQAAITNLVVNARDAMRDGGRVRIHFQDVPADHPDKPPELGDAAAVAIHVVDNGAGMRAPVLQRVLEPFFTTKAPGRGTGLGLAMVHGLMMQSGGALRLESVVGSGTTVSLYIPVSLATAARATEATDADFRVHPGGRVLLVEDDDLVRDVVAGQLADMGYQVVQSDSAAAAMETVADGEALAFVVTDHTLAGSNGVKLVAEVRGIRPNLPILFITGQADPEGMDNETVLLKPFSPGALSKSVLDMMEGAKRLGEHDAALDRLAARFRSTALHRMLANWRSARRGDALPAVKSVAVTRDEMDFVAHVGVDQTHVPMAFELTSVGAELARRAETDFAWWRVDVTGENAETSQEGAYRRCVRSKRPTYDFARFDFGQEGGASFERLLLPCSEDGAGVTSLIAVVGFD